MITVNGLYKNGEIKLLEPITIKEKTKVLVTIVDENIKDTPNIPLDFFNDLIGTISHRKDGSTDHDKYIYSKENLWKKKYLSIQDLITTFKLWALHQ